MAGAKAMVAEARSDIGLSGRPNKYTREYASKHGDEYLTAPFCDMGVTYWAHHSDNAGAVLPAGDRAYTPWHAGDFKKAGAWRSGTAANVRKCRRGDIIFFDWGGTNDADLVDHVGVVEKVLPDGRVQTIEANTGNAVKRRVRAANVIAGYGRPAYADGWQGEMLKKLPLVQKGDRGEKVETVQGLLLARSHPEVSITGKFDEKTEAAVKAVQRWGKVEDDGIVGPQTWPVLLRVA